MRRRDFIALVGSSAVSWPMVARAQQGGRVRRIGVLINLRDAAEIERGIGMLARSGNGGLCRRRYWRAPTR